MRHHRGLLSAIAVTALFACAPTHYEYAPVRTTGAEIAGTPASVHPIPPEKPQGSVRLAMLGLSSLRPTGGLSDSTLRAVRIGFLVSNRSEEAWTVDPAEQRLSITSRHERFSFDATTAEVGRPRLVFVPPRSTRSIELYFPLPMRFDEAAELPAFEVIWTVRVGARAVTERAAFQRFQTDVSPPP